MNGLTAPRPLAALLAPALLLALLALAAPRGAAGADEPKLPSDELLAEPGRATHRFDDFVYTPSERRAEAVEKIARLRKQLAARRLDGVVIATERNMNWLTAGGRDNVVWAQRESPVLLLVTADRLYLIANTIEGPRLMTEEVGIAGFEWVKYAWYEKDTDALAPLIKGKKIAFDLAATAATNRHDPVKDILDFQDVYFPITVGELKKYRWLGHKTAQVLEQVAPAVRPGMTERDVQYLLARELWYWDIFPTVILSVADERFLTYRHPVVTGATLKHLVALNVCGRRWGLVVSTTRVLHFGEPTAALARSWTEGPKVAGAMWAATRAGRTLGDVVAAAQKAYADIGYPEEWKLHHQGGPILTLEWLFLVPPGDKTRIVPGMALAWNPTVQGAKFEDTIYVKEDGGIENLTPTIDWPTVEVKEGSETYKIPVLKVVR